MEDADKVRPWEATEMPRPEETSARHYSGSREAMGEPLELSLG